KAMFRDPHGLVVSRAGQMYVADTLNNRVRKIDLKSRVITTIAGTGEKGFSDDGGTATQATFNGTFGIALDAPAANLYIADLVNRRVRKLDLKSGTIATVAGNKDELVDPRAV